MIMYIYIYVCVPLAPPPSTVAWGHPQNRERLCNESPSRLDGKTNSAFRAHAILSRRFFFAKDYLVLLYRDSSYCFLPIGVHEGSLCAARVDIHVHFSVSSHTATMPLKATKKKSDTLCRLFWAQTRLWSVHSLAGLEFSAPIFQCL